MTTTTPLTWDDIAAKLGEHGVDLTKIKPLQRAPILAELREGAADEQSTTIAGIENRFGGWQQYVDELLEQHATWETPEHRRRRHAHKLFEDEDSIGDYSDTPENYDGEKYVVFREDSDRQRWAAWCDDLEKVANQHFPDTDGDAAEWVDGVYDLDTGEAAKLTIDVVTTVTVTTEDGQITTVTQS